MGTISTVLPTVQLHRLGEASNKMDKRLVILLFAFVAYASAKSIKSHSQKSKKKCTCGIPPDCVQSSTPVEPPPAGAGAGCGCGPPPPPPPPPCAPPPCRCGK